MLCVCVCGGGGGGKKRCVWYNLVPIFFSAKQNRTFHKSFKIQDKFSLFIFL